MARSLGLDVGNRRVGVAVSDSIKVIARPLEVIDRKTRNALQRIIELVHEYQPDEIIVGFPWNTNGTVGDQARAVELFAEQLRSHVQLPLRFYDERYSSGEAQVIISTKKRKDQQRHDDAIAAAVILQRYLDEARTTPPEMTEPDNEDPGQGESEL